MSVHTYALEASLALGLHFYVALPALVACLVSIALILSSGETVSRRPMRVGAHQRGPAR